MAIPTSKAVRGEIIHWLKNDATVTALQPGDRIFPQQVPANTEWPYTYLGTPIDQPDRADCLDGKITRLAIHTYARTTTISGESQCDDIRDAIAASLDGLHLITTWGEMDVTLLPGSTTIRDPSEASAFHGICQIQIEIAS